MSTTYEQERTKRQVEIDEAVLARVKRGLEWLEKTHGPGWEDKIDLDTLNLRDGARCVLGQVYHEEASSANQPDGYWYAREEFIDPDDENENGDLGTAISASLGFTTPHCGERYADNEWDELQRAWEYVLEPRIG